MLTATTLVILMTPGGLTLFYGGLTSYKNVLNTIGMSYVAFFGSTIMWVLISYSLAFSGKNLVFGNFDWSLLLGKGAGVFDVKG